MKSYKTPIDVVLFLEWNTHNKTWEESHTLLEEYRHGSVHTFASPSRRSYITFYGEDRQRIEWPLLTDSKDIHQKARGIPENVILKSIPFDVLTEFDAWLFAERIGRQPPSPSAQLQEVLESVETKPKPKTKPPSNPLPKHVQEILLADAVRTKKDCPIAMEPITLANGSVTSCGHIFTKEALTHWLKQHYTCPECRSIL
jgi:hypothetical protein